MHTASRLSLKDPKKKSRARLANVGDYLTCCLQLKTLSGGGDISETITELLEQLKNVLTGLVPQQCVSSAVDMHTISKREGQKI